MLQEIHVVVTPSPLSAYGAAPLYHCGRTKLLVCSAGERCSVPSSSSTSSTLSSGNSRMLLCERDPMTSSWTRTPLCCPSSVVGDTVAVASYPRGGRPPVFACLTVMPHVQPQASTPQPQSQGAAPSQPLGQLCVFGMRVSAQCAPVSELLDDCQIVGLQFVPVCLRRFVTGRAAGFLVTGTDGSVHAFKESPEFKVEEVALSQVLPELADIQSTSCNSPVICIEIRVSASKRIVVCGCANGFLHLSITDESTDAMTTDQRFLDGPISSLRLYNSDPVVPTPAELHPAAYAVMCRAEDHATKGGGSVTRIASNESPALPTAQVIRPFDLVVGGAVGFVAHFACVNEFGFGQMELLPLPAGIDTVTGVVGADIDFDGSPEIYVSTFANKLLCFARQSPSQPFDFRWAQHFGAPLVGLRHFDLTGDLLENVIVISSRGCHVLQADLQSLRDRVNAELSAIVELRQLEHDVANLQQQ